MKKLLLIEKLHQFLALIFILSFIIYYFWSPFWFGLLWFGLINLILIAIYIPTLFIKMGIERINYFEDFKSFFSEEEIKTNNKITIETEAESIKKTFIQSIITIIGLFTWIIFPLIYWFEIINGWIFIFLIIITSILILMAFQKFEHIEYKSRQDWEKWRDKNNK
jgi:hypothetical protein